MTSTPTGPRKAVRRRASRPAGPTNGKAPEATAVRVATADPTGATPAPKVRKTAPRHVGGRMDDWSQSLPSCAGWLRPASSALRWRS